MDICSPRRIVYRCGTDYMDSHAYGTEMEGSAEGETGFCLVVSSPSTSQFHFGSGAWFDRLFCRIDYMSSFPAILYLCVKQRCLPTLSLSNLRSISNLCLCQGFFKPYPCRAKRDPSYPSFKFVLHLICLALPRSTDGAASVEKVRCLRCS